MEPVNAAMTSLSAVHGEQRGAAIGAGAGQSALTGRAYFINDE
jgi:hypothetical protein